jgi:DNA-binding Xre family transcriptional regulator
VGRWLKEGIAQQSSSLKAAKIQKVLDDYDALRKTTQYKHIRTIRNKSYAHYDQDRKKAEKLASSTWLDVFEMIEKLQRVYDAAAVAGLTTSTTWAMEMPDNGTAVLLQRIEQICHQDAKHERLVREMNPSAGSAS